MTSFLVVDSSSLRVAKYPLLLLWGGTMGGANGHESEGRGLLYSCDIDRQLRHSSIASMDPVVSDISYTVTKNRH